MIAEGHTMDDRRQVMTKSHMTICWFKYILKAYLHNFGGASKKEHIHIEITILLCLHHHLCYTCTC